jgi:amino acid transporter
MHSLILTLLLTLIPLLLLMFWAWMFSDMMKNDNLPSCFITFTKGSDPKFDWTVVFIFLSIVAAIFYYVNEYRNR